MIRLVLLREIVSLSTCLTARLCARALAPTLLYLSSSILGGRCMQENAFVQRSEAVTQLWQSGGIWIAGTTRQALLAPCDSYSRD